MKTKVLRNYRRKSNAGLGEAAQHVHDCLKDTGAFPTAVIAEGTFQTMITDYNTAVAKAINGSQADKATQNTLRAGLLTVMDNLANWADKNADGDPATILSYGFDHTALTHTSSPLATPVIGSVSNIASTKLKLIVAAILNARGYEVQVAIGTGPWVLAAAFPSTRNMILENLLSGTDYKIRVRAVGGSLGYSEWSDSVNHVCT